MKRSAGCDALQPHYQYGGIAQRCLLVALCCLQRRAIDGFREDAVGTTEISCVARFSSRNDGVIRLSVAYSQSLVRPLRSGLLRPTVKQVSRHVLCRARVAGTAAYRVIHQFGGSMRYAGSRNLFCYGRGKTQQVYKLCGLERFRAAAKRHPSCEPTTFEARTQSDNRTCPTVRWILPFRRRLPANSCQSVPGYISPDFRLAFSAMMTIAPSLSRQKAIRAMPPNTSSAMAALQSPAFVL